MSPTADYTLYNMCETRQDNGTVLNTKGVEVTMQLCNRGSCRSPRWLRDAQTPLSQNTHSHIRNLQITNSPAII